MRSLLSSLAVLTAVLSLAAPAQAKLKVVATLPSLGALARDVGGPDVDVNVLASPTEDPHFVDPKPSLIVKLNQADLLIMNGLELEVGWLPKIQVQARNPKLQPGGAGVVDASTLIQLLEVPQGKIDRAQGDIHPGGNPHFLFDPRRGATIATGLAEKMAALDPSIADAVRARAKKVADDILAVGSAARAKVDALPPERRRVVAYHQSLSYLNDWLGLEQVATVEPKPGIPPDPGHVAQVLQIMKAKGATCLLQEEFYPKNTSTTLAQLTGAKLAVLPGGARFSTGETYAQHAQKLADEVVHALQK
jgi:zinc/manganese transport system substrate-binding protein